jgi:hypothetical protein
MRMISYACEALASRARYQCSGRGGTQSARDFVRLAAEAAGEQLADEHLTGVGIGVIRPDEFLRILENEP